MVQLFTPPKEAFISGKPFSFILDENERFKPLDVSNPDNFLFKLWLVMLCFFVEYDGSHIHASRFPCITKKGNHSKKFLKADVLTINTRTGKWMLRQPYSEVYP